MHDMRAALTGGLLLLLSGAVHAHTWDRGDNELLKTTEWSYEGANGPAFWTSIGFPECGGRRQSPIDLDPCDATPARTLTPLTLRGFNRPPLYLEAENDAVTAVFEPVWRGSEPELRAQDRGLLDNLKLPFPGMDKLKLPLPLAGAPRVSGGGLPGTFSVFQFHLHWGANDSVGSEHTIQGRRFPLEMHIVCKNVKYRTLEEALRNVDGIAVLAVLFETTSQRASARSLSGLFSSRGIIQLTPALSRVRPLGAEAEVASPPSMLQLMPVNTNRYFSYSGSLTTPGCYEVVTWIVFAETVRVVDVELNILRSLRGNNAAPIVNNFRPAQRRNGRILRYRGGMMKGLNMGFDMGFRGLGLGLGLGCSRL